MLAALLPSAVALCLAVGSFAVPALCAFGATHGPAAQGGAHEAHGATAAAAADHHGAHGAAAAGAAHADHAQHGAADGGGGVQAPAPLQACCCDVELTPAAGVVSSAGEFGRCVLPGPALRAVQLLWAPPAPSALLRARSEHGPDLAGRSYARAHAPLLI